MQSFTRKDTQIDTLMCSHPCNFCSMQILKISWKFGRFLVERGMIVVMLCSWKSDNRAAINKAFNATTLNFSSKQRNSGSVVLAKKTHTRSLLKQLMPNKALAAFLRWPNQSTAATIHQQTFMMLLCVSFKFQLIFFQKLHLSFALLMPTIVSSQHLGPY